MTEHVARAVRKKPYHLKDGTVVPGATTVLKVLDKPALIRWAWKLGRDGYSLDSYMDELAEIGKLAHRMIQDYLNGKKPRHALYDDASVERFKKAQVPFNKFLDWYKRHKVKVLHLEHEVVSEEYRFGGTIDAILEVDGRREICDWKTAKGIYEEHFFQVAGYATAAWENGIETDGVRILQVGRTPLEGFSERALAADDIAPYWDVFEAALQVYHAKERLAKTYSMS